VRWSAAAVGQAIDQTITELFANALIGVQRLENCGALEYYLLVIKSFPGVNHKTGAVVPNRAAIFSE
jgi:hypothetical protein